jgi:hypothetical protein
VAARRTSPIRTNSLILRTFLSRSATRFDSQVETRPVPAKSIRRSFHRETHHIVAHDRSITLSYWHRIKTSPTRVTLHPELFADATREDLG